MSSVLGAVAILMNGVRSNCEATGNECDNLCDIFPVALRDEASATFASSVRNDVVLACQSTCGTVSRKRNARIVIYTETAKHTVTVTRTTTLLL